MPDDRIRDEHERDLRAIAHLVARIRPEWHQPGVMAALRDCPDGKLADTAVAALICARDRTDQATPAVIALDGAHWRTTPGSAPPPPPDRGPDCHHCGHSRDAHPDLLARMPGYCPGFERNPDRTPGRRPDATRNLRRDRNPA